ncbi:MAG: hypothetical protein KKE20_02985 [Nanoarchaeota archaeon]|nr:hypothetical protein [Nanoarchaeota archaeon]
MAEKIYSVDLSKAVTPKIARDAVILCVSEAYKGNISKSECERIVKERFKEAGADFDNPTKDGIMKACERLSVWSSEEKRLKDIEKHFFDILKVLNKIK